MAEDIALKLTVDAVNAAKNVKELKDIIKAAANEALKFEEGTAEFNKFAAVAAEAKDKMGDFKERLDALNPDGRAKAFATLGSTIAGGFSAATAAAALFGNESEDLQKTLLKVQAASALAQGIQQVGEMGKAFNVLGAIIKANPIFLIVSVIAGIGTALFALKDKVKFLSDAFEFLGDVLGTIKDAFFALTDAIGLTTHAQDELYESIVKNSKAAQEANEIVAKSIEKRYNREIALAKAAGKDTFDLEKEKTRVMIAEGTKQIKALENQLAYSKDLKKEDKLALEQSLRDARNAVIDAGNELDVINAERTKKNNEEFLKNQRLRNEELNKEFGDTFHNIDKLQLKTVESTQLALREVQSTQQAVALTLAETIQVQATALDDFNTNHQNTFNSVVSLFEALEKLSDGNSKSQKAFAVSQAIINSYLASTKALATLPPPANFIGAAAALLNGFASVKGILKTPSKTGAAPTAPSFGGGNGLPGGSVDIKQFANSQSTLIPKDANGDVKNTRVYVLEKDITTTQQKVSSIETKALIK